MWQKIRHCAKKLAGNLDFVQAGVLFAIIAVLNLLLFYELAGESVIFKVIFSALAISMDSTKIVLWIRGTRERNRVFVTLALTLATVSLFCSSGSALMVVSRGDKNVATMTNLEGGLERRRLTAQENVASWTERLDKVPPEYTSQVKVVAEELRKANEALEAVEREIEAASRASNSTVVTQALTMFRLMAEKIKVDEKALRLAFLLVVFTLLEGTALATSYRKPVARARVMSLALDAQGTSHVLVKGRALCGKPAPFTMSDKVRKPCDVCMERSMKDA